MKQMNINKFIEDWLRASNNFDTEKYLQMYHEDAVLDDPSVGNKFIGHQGIKNYFESYFIGYKTSTELIHIEINDDKAYLEVEFTGNFPEGKIKGTFDFTFKDNKIAKAKADLI
jgi:ketosteroid isomerase-like protein